MLNSYYRWQQPKENEKKLSERTFLLCQFSVLTIKLKSRDQLQSFQYSNGSQVNLRLVFRFSFFFSFFFGYIPILDFPILWLACMDNKVFPEVENEGFSISKFVYVLIQYKITKIPLWLSCGKFPYFFYFFKTSDGHPVGIDDSKSIEGEFTLFGPNRFIPYKIIHLL